MEPTYKAPSIEDMLTAITGKSRPDTIRNGECVTCDVEGLTEASFKDAISVGEYIISGMCQQCQDKTFGGDD